MAKAKGRAAKNVIASQLAVVSTNACLTDMRPGGVMVVRRRVIPIKAVNPADPANTCQSGCPVIRSATKGAHIAKESVVSKIPITCSIGRKSSTGSSSAEARLV